MRRCSDPHFARRRVRKTYLWKGERAEAVHGRQAEDQGRYHEGYQNGAYTQEGANQGEAIDSLYQPGQNLATIVSSLVSKSLLSVPSNR